MVRIDDAVIARLKRGGEVFEVLVDCDKALEYQQGKIDSLEDVLATRDIYKDVKQAEHASEHEMNDLFHTTDANEVAAIIVKEGEIQLTSEHKSKLREEKRKQVLQLLHRNTINAQTGAPHPVALLETALHDAKVKIDEFKSAEDQLPEVISKLTSVLPIKVEKREIEVVIPASHAGAALGQLKRMAKILRDEWQNDGSLKAVLEIPAGIQEEVEHQLSQMTKGEYELTVLNKK